MRSVVISAALFLAAGAAVLIHGSSRPSVSASQAVQPAASSQEAGADPAVRVPEPGEKALQYYRSGNYLWMFNMLWGILVPAVILFTGFSARLRDWAQRIGKRWFFVIGVYVVLFSLVNFVIDLPLSYYQEYVRQHAYGLSNQTFAKWLSDSFKALGVAASGGILFMWIPFLLLKKSPRRWWLYTALLSVPFLLIVLLIGPVWIDPLFNDYGPMKDKELEREILRLAERAGIEGGRVFEVDKSVDTNAVNAYVTGFLGSKRIVLWDTILKKLDRREVLVVMGHEMGHYVLGHVRSAIAFAFAVILLSLYLAYRVAEGLVRRFSRRFGFDRLSDVAALPLLLLLVGLYSFAISPVTLAFSRYQEHEADRFALEITRDNHAAGNAFVKLQKENLGIPRPGLLYKLWRSSHPPIGERIDFCNAYRPWQQGKRLKYGEYMRESP